MSETPGTARPHLHVVRPVAVVDRAALMAAVEACVAGRPEGLPPSELVPALAAHLGIEADAIVDAELDGAMGMLVVTGRIDETGGLLVPSAPGSSSAATG